MKKCYLLRETEAGCHALLQGIFLTQGSNQYPLDLLHWQVIIVVRMKRDVCKSPGSYRHMINSNSNAVKPEVILH